MEEIFVFPMSMLIVTGFCTMWYQSHPKSLVARGIAYLFGIMLIISAGMLVTILTIAYIEDLFAPNIVGFVTAASAVIVFLKSINKISIKTLIILFAALAAAAAAAWGIMVLV